METTKIFALENAKNMFGKINPKIKARIEMYLSNPTSENWDDIHGILITKSQTIWQAVIAVDKTFNCYGRQINTKGKIIKDWVKIPDVQILKAAITNAILIYENHLN